MLSSFGCYANEDYLLLTDCEAGNDEAEDCVIHCSGINSTNGTIFTCFAAVWHRILGLFFIYRFVEAWPFGLSWLSHHFDRKSFV